jgi:hypothetical protein
MDCNLDQGDIISAADTAYQQNGVFTFSIGLEGASESLMNGIAHAGGTEEAIIIGTENAQEELASALEEIRNATVACEYVVPATDDEGNEVDPGAVNVLYTPGDGSGKVTIGQVANAEACTASGGWYYDDPEAPTRILFCDATCLDVQGDAGAQIKILLGCATIPA